MSLSINEYFALAGSSYTHADARVIGPVLQELAKAGDVTPSQVVDAARSTNSPLHSYFEWDDKVAANKFRADQADDMIRSVRVKYVSSGRERVARAYTVRTLAPLPRQNAQIISLPIPRERGFEPLAAAALRDLDAWRLKYEDQMRLYGRFADAVTPIINQISEFKEDFKAGHLSGPLRKAIERFLEWEVEYATLAAARLYGEHINYIMQAIADVRDALGPLDHLKESNAE